MQRLASRDENASVDPEPSIKGNTVPTIYFKLVILVSYYTFVYYRYSDVCYCYILSDPMMYYCNVKSTPLYGYQATGMLSSYTLPFYTLPTPSFSRPLFLHPHSITLPPSPSLLHLPSTLTNSPHLYVSRAGIMYYMNVHAHFSNGRLKCSFYIFLLLH